VCLLNAAAYDSDNESVNVNQSKYEPEIRLTAPKPICVIKSVYQFNFSSASARSIVELYDGESTLEVLLDETLEQFVIKDDPELQKAYDQRFTLVAGKVLMIDSYKTGSIFNRELCNNVYVFVLKGYTCVGMEESTCVTEIKQPSTNQIFQIRDLTEEHSRSNWTITAQLTEIGMERKWLNSLGTVQRFQLKDSSGYIEMVVFNDSNRKPMITDMVKNKFYSISRGKIKKAKSTFLNWPKTKNCTGFEIQFDPIVTKIAETSPPPACVDKTLLLTIENTAKEQNEPNESFSHFTKINKLLKIFKREEPDQYVNVIGCVESVGELEEQTIPERQYGSKILPAKNAKLRRIQLFDDSDNSKTVSVTLWDKNVKLDFKAGTIISLLNVKLTLYYGKVNLSFMNSKSTLTDITDAESEVVRSIKKDERFVSSTKTKRSLPTDDDIGSTSSQQDSERKRHKSS
jgi:hypothetical protein